MTYDKALLAMEEGKKLSREGWGSLFGWYYITKEKDKLVMNDPMNGMPAIVSCWEYSPSESDKNSNDWKIIEKARTWR